MKKQRIAIVGAGEMGLQAAHIISSMSRGDMEYEVCGWFDDTLVEGSLVHGCRVFGGTDSIISTFEAHKFDYLFIAIGYKHLDAKQRLIDTYKVRIPLTNIVSPEAIIDPTVKLGYNIMIYPGAIIDKEVIIEDGVTINLGSIISHNTYLKKSTFFAPGVTVAGFCEIGSCSFIGVGSTIIDNIKICDNVQIGGGAVVTQHIKEGGLYVGMPAKKINR